GDAEEQGYDDNSAEEPVTAVADVQSPPPQQQSPPPAQPQGADFPMSLLQELERANKVKNVKLRRLRKVGTSQRIESSDDTIMEDVSNQGRMIDESNKDEGAELMKEKEEKETEEVRVNPDDAQVEGRQADIYHIDMDHATKVLTDVPAAPVNAAAVVTTTAPVKVDVTSTRRRRGVVIRDPKEESSAQTPTETKSKDKGKRKLQEELNQDIDWEVAMDHVKKKAKENPYVQRYQVMKKRPQTEAHARRNMMVYLKNTVGFTLDFLKGLSYDDIRPVFEAKFNENMEFLLKSKEHMEEEENRAIALINETPAQKVAKRRRLNKEVEDVKELK
nr:hypothetical protein [Tanacetum cinerariifolium]